MNEQEQEECAEGVGAATLRRAYEQLEPKRERHRNDPYLVNLDGRWPLLAATVSDPRRDGPLGRPLEATPEESALTEASVGAAQPDDVETPDPATATGSGDAAGFELAEALLARRRQLEEEARRDVAAARAGRRSDDLRPSRSDGSMPDLEATEESWR